jgi:hypothetical protein
MQATTTLSCKDRRKLAEEYAIATRVYSDAVARLAQHSGISSEEEYHSLRMIMVEARNQSENAAMEFERHLAKHCC